MSNHNASDGTDESIFGQGINLLLGAELVTNDSSRDASSIKQSSNNNTRIADMSSKALEELEELSNNSMRRIDLYFRVMEGFDE